MYEKNPCGEIMLTTPRYSCDTCTNQNVENVKRLGLNYCVRCSEVLGHIPVEQIRHYIKEKFYGYNKD